MKIIVGLSGGVDSAVAAYLLKQKGCDVEGVYMQNWHDTEGTLHGECEWEEERIMAEMVAKSIDIPFHFVDLSDDYRKEVVEYMFSEYEAGRTPNPDVLCNSKIKFDSFLKVATSLGGDYIATGHYCKKKEITLRQDDGSERTVYQIFAGDDPGKDQSYFLCRLTQAQLSKAIFPIGHLLKEEVRSIARKAHLPCAERKDSQGICFVGKVKLPLFLQQKLKPVEGNVIEILSDDYQKIKQRSLCEVSSPCTISTLTDEELIRLSTPVTYTPSDGKVIAKHDGIQYYTIGQRHGLNIGGHHGPLFILATDKRTNTIYVGEGKDHPGLYRSGMKLQNVDIHWIREDMAMAEGEKRDYLLRIRYRQKLQKATLYKRPDGLYIIFEKPQRSITPGQFAVWYDPQTLEMIGSGVI